MAMINSFLALSQRFISRRHQNPQWDVWFARLLSSHLPATCEQLDGQEAFHSFLFLLLRLMPEPLMHAAACHTQGKTTWTEMKWNLYIWLHGNPFNSTVIYCWLLFHVLFTSCQLVRCCLQTLLCRTNTINTHCYIAPKWKLGQHLLSLSFGEIRTCWTDAFKTVLTVWTLCIKSIKYLDTKLTLNQRPPLGSRATTYSGNPANTSLHKSWKAINIFCLKSPKQ